MHVSCYQIAVMLLGPFHQWIAVRNTVAPLDDGRQDCARSPNSHSIIDPGLCLRVLLQFIEGPIKEQKAPSEEQQSNIGEEHVVDHAIRLP